MRISSNSGQALRGEILLFLHLVRQSVSSITFDGTFTNFVFGYRHVIFKRYEMTAKNSRHFHDHRVDIVKAQNLTFTQIAIKYYG